MCLLSKKVNKIQHGIYTFYLQCTYLHLLGNTSNAERAFKSKKTLFEVGEISTTSPGSEAPVE